MKSDYFKQFFTFSLGQHRFIELHKTKEDVKIRSLGFDFDLQRKPDHGGFLFTFAFLGHAFIVDVHHHSK